MKQKQLIGIFQIPEEDKIMLEVVLSDFNKDRPARYHLNFSLIYRALVSYFLEDQVFRSDLIGHIEKTQIAVPVLTCPFCDNSTEGFRMFSSPYQIMCGKCTKIFNVPKKLQEYQASKKLLDMAKSKISGVTDFEKIVPILCIQCGAGEDDQDIPAITDHIFLAKQIMVTCRKCGFVRNAFGKLSSREDISKKMLMARQRLRCFDPEELRVDEE